jgi:hypothetical protein
VFTRLQMHRSDRSAVDVAPVKKPMCIGMRRTHSTAPEAIDLIVCPRSMLIGSASPISLRSSYGQ